MDRHPALLVVGATALALTATALAPSAASASCAPRSASEVFAQADVAFVGRFTGERRGDRLVFAVDEPLKGPLGPTVEIRPNPGGVTTVTLNPTPGESIGLASRTAADGAQESNDCQRTAPENLRAAAAAPNTDCTAPRVTGLRALDGARTRQSTRFRVLLAGAEGRLDRVRIDWGDGSARTYRRDPEGADANLVVTHRFRRRGVRRVRATASARPVLACGTFGLPSRIISPRKTLAVRVR